MATKRATVLAALMTKRSKGADSERSEAEQRLPGVGVSLAPNLIAHDSLMSSKVLNKFDLKPVKRW